MANQPYFPKREGDQTAFFTNLQSKVARYYVALDISPARQAKLQLALSWLIWAWQTFIPARRAGEGESRDARVPPHSVRR